MADEKLRQTARELVAEGKGILAADESIGTMNKRLEAVGAEATEDNRRAFRELMFTAGGSEAISGVILFDETFRQNGADGTPLRDILASNGIMPGIKVDTGAKPLAGAPDETITEGLDGLRGRLEEYVEMGARFAKWRAVIAVDSEHPTRYALRVNAQALARYAALCQEAGVVPIVEPECLMDGDHTIDRSEEVTREVLAQVFAELREQRVDLRGMLLKPNMVLSGYACPQQADVEEVARRTLAVFAETVPAAVPGVVFLSGGQSDEAATAHLNAMARMGPHPWEVSFSYGRGLQAAALAAWHGDAASVAGAQAIYRHRARLTGAARRGAYVEDMERELVGA